MINTVLTSIFGGLAALLVLSGFAFRGERWVLWTAGLFAAGAAAAAHNDAFWPMVLLGVLSLWFAFAAVDVMDLGWRMRCALTVSACLFGFLVLWPTLPSWSSSVKCPAYIQDHVSFRLVAGLDLRGGLRLVYTVDVDEAIKDKRDHYYEDMRLELAKIFGLHQGDDLPSEDVYKKLRDKVEIESPRRPVDEIRVHVKDGTDPSKLDERFMEKFRQEMSFSRTQDQRTLVFKVRSNVGSQIRERAVSQAKDIILRRVDELGLREAAVSSRDEDIIVEVPGEDEKSFATIREIISQTARLEFKMLDDDTDFFGGIQKSAKEETLPEGLEFKIENAPVGKDDEGSTKTKANTFAVLAKQPKETTTQTLQRMREWVSTLDVPADREVGYGVEKRVVDEVTLREEESGIRTYFLKSRAEITGDMIREAVAQPEQSQGSMGGWHVSITFTDAGGRIFERITGANIKRRFAIILDGRVSSAPVIQGRIAGGHGQITMGSGDPEAQLRDSKNLELVLRSGALPAPISPSNEQRIGPSLGQDAIKLGIQGALGGIGLVLVFMMIYYQRAGFIADIAVVMNLFLQLAILSSFGASMTLPGIAGLALTVGMAVDNNIIINERIREELGLGKSPRAAVDVGYKRALNAIIDGHVTTVIAGLVLAQYGTGPLKGFAVTLMVGVICNIFTGVIVSRLMVDLWVKNLGRGAQLDLG
ncbi:MAG TPA: protein translocase subunit SecD [Polyangiaceae bacterium]|nr:protein translocase subunit SecD [Polyangiaceae bacterium]